MKKQGRKSQIRTNLRNKDSNIFSDVVLQNKDKS